MARALGLCDTSVYHRQMADLADVRLANTAALFDEFKSTAVVGPAGDELKGLEARFAEQLRISASYWSQLKSRNRHIGETLARQFEAKAFLVIAAPAVIARLSDEQPQALAELEEQLHRPIRLQAEPQYLRDAYDVVPL